MSNIIMKYIFVSIFVAVCVLNYEKVNCSKILMSYPTFSPSNLIVASGLLKGLAKRGHDVTMISSFPQKTKVKNYRDIYIELPKSIKEYISKTVHDKKNFNMFKIWSTLPEMYKYANSAMSHPEVIKLMNEETFDLVIIPPTFGRFFAGFAAHFDCPLAILTQLRATTTITDLIGNPYILSTSPHIMANFKSPMSFMDRVKNFIFHCVEFIVFNVDRYLNELYYDMNFKSPKYPKLENILRNTSLILSNYHFSQGLSFPNLPNVIEIGGIQIKEDLSPLPKDLQEFMDSAEEGVIYFSFGSNLKSDHLSEEKADALWEALTLVKQKVVMKWEREKDLKKKPSNIFISKWLPQNEILAHRNTRLFVSHGGGGSLVESKFYGVPVVAIPMFGDQMGNSDMAVKERWAIQLEFLNLTRDGILEAIDRVINEPSYINMAKKLSELYKDRPQTAMDTAAYWIEYVIRHKGAHHMKYPGAEMNVFQLYSLDVIGFLLFMSCLVIKISCVVLCAILNLFKRCKKVKTN